MADTELDILIRMLANTQGADAVQAALNKTKDATNDANTAGGKLNETTHEGTKEGEKFEVTHRAIHQILHLIASQSGPAMGAAISGAVAAGTGSTLLLIMAVRELFEWIKKTQERAQEMRAEAADAQVSVFEAHRQAMNDATQAANDYHDALIKVKSVADELKQSDTERETILKAQIDAAKQLLEFQEKQALLAANGNKQEEERVRNIFEGKKHTADMTGDVAQIVQKRDELSQTEMNVAAAKKRYDDAHAARAAAAGDTDEAARAQAEMDAIKSRAGTGEKDATDALFKAAGLGEGATVDAAKVVLAKIRRDAQALPDTTRAIGEGDPGLSPRQAAMLPAIKIQKALDTLEKTETRINELNQVVQAHNTTIDKLKKSEDRAKEEFEKLRDQAEATRNALKTAEELYGVTSSEARAEGRKPPGIPAPPGHNNGAAATTEEVVRRIQQTEDGLYAILQGGGQLDKSQSVTLRAILQMQTGHIVTQQKMLSVITALYQDGKALDAAFDRLTNLVQQDRSRMNRPTQ